MRGFKRVVALFLSVVMMLALLAGCGSRKSAVTEKPQGSANPSGEQVKNKDIILATTTSTQDSGLLDVLIPLFENKTGYKVKTIAVGTGQALAMGDKGEADVMLVHAPADEIKRVESGVAVNRQLVAHNDFVLIGPSEDPAGIKGLKVAAEAFKEIAQAQAVFVSRGDDSGTHKKEKDIWKSAGMEPSGNWYQQSGSGMGQTLNIANEKQGYAITDRATYLSLKKNLSLEILLEGEAILLNIYHVMQVNPQKFNKVNADGGKAFVDFFISKEAQDIIAKFGSDKYGQPLFFADAGKKVEDLGK